MRPPYRPEPAVAATTATAIANLKILQTQAACAREPLTHAQRSAALEIACRLAILAAGAVRDHSPLSAGGGSQATAAGAPRQGFNLRTDPSC
jgi:hypothetical protein